jgi:hypothetical protein
LRSFNACNARVSFVVEKPAQGRPRRFGSAVGCADFAAPLVVFGSEQPKPRPRVVRHPAGAISAATRSAGLGEARPQGAL